MNKIHEAYVESGRKGEVMAFSVDERGESLKSIIEKNPEYAGILTDKAHLKEDVILKRIGDHYECDVLFMVNNGTKKGEYMELDLDDRVAHEEFSNLPEGEPIHIYVRGDNYSQLIKDLKSRGIVKEHKDEEHNKKPLESIIFEENGEYCINYEVHIDLGFHARPSSVIVQKAQELEKQGLITADSKVYISNGDTKADTLSIMSVMMLGVAKGEKATISGSSQEAVQQMYDTIKKIPHNY